MTGKIAAAVCICVLVMAQFTLSQGSYAAENPARDDNESVEDDIVVVVSRLNSVHSLTRAQVEDLFLGRTQQFPNGSRAVPIDHAEGSAVRERFNAQVLDRTSAQVRTHWSRILFTGRGQPPRSVASSEEALRIVADNPQAIGYLERRFVNDGVVVVFE